MSLFNGNFYKFFFSFIIVPLMSVLEGRVHMTPGQGAIILAAGLWNTLRR